MSRIPSFLFATLAALSTTLAGRAAPATPPNIVLIVADDLGYADVLFNPEHPKEVTTPNLDRLAKESVIFRQGYVTAHVCSPTREGLMTGRYQQRLGLYTGGEAGSGLPKADRKKKSGKSSPELHIFNSELPSRNLHCSILPA